LLIAKEAGSAMVIGIAIQTESSLACGCGALANRG
jgi:hypothetical protein